MIWRAASTMAATLEQVVTWISRGEEVARA